jgi:hypothetical protein
VVESHRRSDHFEKTKDGVFALRPKLSQDPAAVAAQAKIGFLHQVVDHSWFLAPSIPEGDARNHAGDQPLVPSNKFGPRIC